VPGAVASPVKGRTIGGGQVLGSSAGGSGQTLAQSPSKPTPTAAEGAQHRTPKKPRISPWFTPSTSSLTAQRILTGEAWTRLRSSAMQRNTLHTATARARGSTTPHPWLFRPSRRRQDGWQTASLRPPLASASGRRRTRRQLEVARREDQVVLLTLWAIRRLLGHAR
jgi:hypothetical protein